MKNQRKKNRKAKTIFSCLSGNLSTLPFLPVTQMFFRIRPESRGMGHSTFSKVLKFHSAGNLHLAVPNKLKWKTQNVFPSCLSEWFSKITRHNLFKTNGPHAVPEPITGQPKHRDVTGRDLPVHGARYVKADTCAPRKTVCQGEERVQRVKVIVVTASAHERRHLPWDLCSVPSSVPSSLFLPWRFLLSGMCLFTSASLPHTCQTPAIPRRAGREPASIQRAVQGTCLPVLLYRTPSTNPEVLLHLLHRKGARD